MFPIYQLHFETLTTLCFMSERLIYLFFFFICFFTPNIIFSKTKNNIFAGVVIRSLDNSNEIFQNDVMSGFNMTQFPSDSTQTSMDMVKPVETKKISECKTNSKISKFNGGEISKIE